MRKTKHREAKWLTCPRFHGRCEVELGHLILDSELFTGHILSDGQMSYEGGRGLKVLREERRSCRGVCKHAGGKEVGVFTAL